MGIKYNASVDTKILGGLPVTIRMFVTPPDKSVGIMGPTVEDWEIVSRSGKPLGNWINKRVEETPGEAQRILDACYDYLATPPDYEPD